MDKENRVTQPIQIVRKHTVLALLCLSPVCGSSFARDQEPFSVTDLRCENLVDPTGIDIAKPRLSWQMLADNSGAAQTAYRILCATAPDLLKEGSADLWDSGRIATDECQQIRYAGKTLARGVPYYWTVRIWNEKGTASSLAPPAMWPWFDMAATKDWQARWITHNASSPWLRKSVELTAIPERAYIYVNSVGYFQLFINSKRVGADEFTPHLSQPDKRSFCLTYDVTDYLVEGRNAIGLWLGKGWSGQTDVHGSPSLPSPAVRAQLEMADADGQITTLATDDTWSAKSSCMAYRGQWRWNRYGGEVHNGGLDQPDWAAADFDDREWPKAKQAKVADTVVSAEMLQRSRVIETITPVQVSDLSAVVTARSNNRVAAGEKIEIKIRKALYGVPGEPTRQIDVREELQAMADAGQYRFEVSNGMAGRDPAVGKQKLLVLEYDLNGRGVSFSINELEECSLAAVGGPSTTWFVDMGKTMTGTFEINFPKASKGRCISMQFGDTYTPGKNGGLPKLNSFSQVSEYICRGSGTERFKNRFNYASCRYILIRNAPEGEITPEDIKGYFITTDLPKASTFNCSDKTLNEIYSMIDHTLLCLMLGGYQVDCHSRERMGYGGDGQASLDTTLSFLHSDAFYRKWTRDWVDGQKPDGRIADTAPASRHGGGPFWAGFLTAATLKHYYHYGDLDLLKQNYPAIKKWVEMFQSKMVDNVQLPFCVAGYLGDWATPRGMVDRANDDIFIHSYMAYVLGQAAELADVLGETSDASTFRRWAADRNVATHKKFYDPKKGGYGSGHQVTYVLPLLAGVVPDELYDDIFAGFERTLLVKDKGHLSTGLSGTYLMIQYLQSIGRDDLIYTFASKRTFPSWGYMIDNGATATWEHWDGKASRIHNCYNSIGAWFIQSLAGIRPDPQNPGFKNAIIKPAFIKALSYVNGSHDSVYGTIQSHWKRQGDAIIMTVKIPANSSATVYVPAGDLSDVTVNGGPIEKAEHVEVRKSEMGQLVVDLGAGSYEFVCRQPATSESKKGETNVIPKGTR